MKIESIIKRDPPTSITLGETTYQFEIDADGRHVCEVTNQHHLARLLSIPEGYRLAIDGEQPVVVPKPAAAPIQTVQTLQPVVESELVGSPVHPSVIDLGEGRTVQLTAVIQQAFTESGMTVAEWNEQDEDDRYAKIDAVLDAMVAPPADEAAALDREQLADAYEAKFGRRPHGKWTAEKIAAAMETEDGSAE